MPTTNHWNRQQLLVAFNLYCRLPFGKFHSRNPEIIRYAGLINRTPSALAMKLSNIASLDPAITDTGRRGLEGASKADKMMWEEMQNNWAAFAIESNQAQVIVTEPASSESPEQKLIAEEDDHTGSDKIVQTKARVGQTFFRQAVLSAYNYRCAITGLSVPKLLVASHIIPWRKDEKNRLNPRNGLSLSMLHDKAFDVGIITINEDMTVRVSKNNYPSGDEFYTKALLQYDGKPIFLPDKFPPNPAFLEYHREHIFEATPS
ncbi:MAG: HNH endonuclease [Porticoccaceae bacterium]|nr:HNH endonuclease [Porticoccaceae bacterium]